jgi:hypothetical protein
MFDSNLPHFPVNGMAQHRRVGLWFLRDRRLCWFGFVSRGEAVRVARAIRWAFGCPAVIHDFWWEPDAA